MTQHLPALAATIAAMIVVLATGYRCWRRRRDLAPPDTYALRHSREHEPLGAMPLVSGVTVGLLVLSVLVHVMPQPDRFHSAITATGLALSVAFGGFLIVTGPVLLLALGLVRRTHRVGKDDATPESLQPVVDRHQEKRRLILLSLEVIAASLVAFAGARIPLLSLPGWGTVELGTWAIPVTIVWIVIATNAVKLLDGLDGASNVLLLAASALIFTLTLGAQEPLLLGMSLVCAGAALVSLRFNLYPARLRLSGSGVAYVGFLFAVLTVLARQKTVALFLFALPVLLIGIIAGGAMIAFLERNTSPDAKTSGNKDEQ